MTESTSGTIRVNFPDAAIAEVARQSLEPDNAGHLDAKVEGTELVLICTSDSIMGLLRSFDDALACLRALGE